ncbi:MAG: hypothetical protein KF850_02280 [Labilithrix sp.]|nr:hypothetical protein [Labilithrix sp.]
MRRRLAVAIVAGLAVGVAAWRLEQARLGPDREAACAEAGGATLDHDGVRVLVGSELATDGALRPGHVARCDERAAATATFIAVRAAVRDARWPDLPPVVVHFDPRGGAAGARTHRARAEVLVPAGGPLDATVLSHELTHVVVLARRAEAPRSDVGRRVIAVLDEGVADFAAAVATGRGVVGDPARGPTRDLGRPPRVSVEGWAHLASTSTPFDPHLLGWDLAAALFARAGADRQLRDDLTAAVAAARGEDMGPILASLVSACAERSRPLLRSILAEWVPGELSLE